MTRERLSDLTPAGDGADLAEHEPGDIAEVLQPPHDPEAPEADALEQELRVTDEPGEVGGLLPDSERTEPVDDSGYDY